MATHKCSKCGRSTSSWTHRRDCLGMSRRDHLARNRNRSHSSRACSKPDLGRILARPSAYAGIVADGAFYTDQVRNRPSVDPARGEA